MKRKCSMNPDVPEVDVELLNQLDSIINDKTLDEAIQKIPHSTTSASGKPLTFDDIFFLLKMSPYGACVRKLFPYESFTTVDGRHIPGKNHFDSRISQVVKLIFNRYDCSITDEYLSSAISSYEAKFTE